MQLYTVVTFYDELMCWKVNERLYPVALEKIKKKALCCASYGLLMKTADENFIQLLKI